jgi:hypothetical protein
VKLLVTVGRRSVLAIAGVGAVLSLGSCASDPREGYSLTPSHDQALQTVHVPMFGNKTFFRGIEMELTDAITKEIQANTPWRVVGQGNADTVLTGMVTNSDLKAISTAEGSGLVQEQGVEIVLEFTWRNNRTGKVLVQRRNFKGADIFIPARLVGESLETGQNAAIQRLAKSVVDEMRSSW